MRPQQHFVCVCVSQGHVDEMWGLATHPSQNIFLSCGHDRQVCLWNTEEHMLDWCISLEVGGAATHTHTHTHALTWSCVSLTGLRAVC